VTGAAHVALQRPGLDIGTSDFRQGILNEALLAVESLLVGLLPDFQLRGVLWWLGDERLAPGGGKEKLLGRRLAGCLTSEA